MPIVALSLTYSRDYLKRVNLYRQRVWRCKVTGKSNLTYEEALVSEHRATENVQQFPKDLMPRVLHMIQFSKNRNNACSYFFQLITFLTPVSCSLMIMFYYAF